MGLLAIGTETFVVLGPYKSSSPDSIGHEPQRSFPNRRDPIGLPFTYQHPTFQGEQGSFTIPGERCMGTAFHGKKHELFKLTRLDEVGG